MKLSFRLFILAAAVGLLSSCATRVFDDPIAVWVDHESPSEWKHAAIAQTARGDQDSVRYVAALRTVLWEPGYPTWQRRWALAQLVEADPAALRADIGFRLAHVDTWAVIEVASDGIALQGWVDATAAIVRSLARPARGVDDTDRPEYGALTALYPNQQVVRTVEMVFRSEIGAPRIDDRVAAWQLLGRLCPPDDLRDRLASAPPDTALVSDLQAAASVLATLPTHREQVLRLMSLRAASNGRDWAHFESIVASLAPAKRDGLTLGHFGVLRGLDQSQLDRDRSEILTRIRADLESAYHVLRSPEGDLHGAPHPQRLEDWAEQLSWTDLQALSVVSTALRDRALIDELFRQADADHRDRRSEHGGVLDWQNGRLHAHPYTPAIKQHDRIFHPSTKMIEHLYSAVAHYHYHAQRYDNDDYAGPGKADRELADRLGCVCVVFTLIDRDRLNVDYYQPGGVVIDLGTVSGTIKPSRPGSRGHEARGPESAPAAQHQGAGDSAR